MLFNKIDLNIKQKKEIFKNARESVRYLSVEIGDRSFSKIDNLFRARDYIKKIFEKNAYEVKEESYIVHGKSKPDDIILVGAHYDTVEGTPGADDNATAVAALLEFSRLLSNFKNKKTIRFVAFTLEEPPFYKTEDMGSRRYAKGCKDRNENIELMICLEIE